MTYLGVFATAGVVVFELAFLTTGPGPVPGTRRRLHVLAGLAAAVAALGAASSALAARGQESVPGLLTDPAPAAALTVAGLLGAVVGIRGAAAGPSARGDRTVILYRATALAGAGVAALSLVLTGHTRSAQPGWLVVIADAAHMAARGLILGRRILGSTQALVSTGYGQMMLIKLALVGLVILVAAWNRFVLLPRVLTGDRTNAMSSLRSAVQGEAAVLGLVLLITGVLTNLSP